MNHAIEEGDINRVKKLLKKIVDIEKIDVDRTFLMIAAEEGKYDIAELLLDNGASTETKNKYGKTALMYAANMEQYDVTKLLIKRGANVNAADRDGRTVLMYSVHSPKGVDKKIVNFILNSGANPFATDDDGKTALDWAIADFNPKNEVIRLVDESMKKK